MPVGAGVAIAGIAGNVISSNAASSASKRGTAAAIAEANKARELASPYLQTGNQALELLNDPNKLREGFQEDPGYQFRLNRGLEGVSQNKAISGLLRSGSTLKDSIGFAGGLASQEYGNYYNRIYDRAQLGVTGLNAATGAINNNVQSIRDNASNQAEAALNVGNSVNQAIGMGARYAQNAQNAANPQQVSSSYV